MASEKKPSIYYDRSTIGSSDELDEYGVWVKSEPQDLSSVNAENNAENKEVSEPSLPEMDDLPDFDIGQDAETGGEDDFALDSFDDNDFADVSGEDSQEEDGSFDDADSEFTGIDLPAEMSVGDSEDFQDTDESEESVSEESFDLDKLPEPEEPAGEDMKEDAEAGREGFTEVSMDDFLTDSSVEPEEPVMEESSLEDSFLEFEEDKEKAESPRPEPVKPGDGKPASPDLSTQLLMKIAEELSSIRTELSDLKREFSVIRNEASSGEEQSDPQNHGFFDEEDDEKIALTGDELNNILNTADFTEEAGADATSELSSDFDTLDDKTPDSVSFTVEDDGISPEGNAAGLFPEPPLEDTLIPAEEEILSSRQDILSEETGGDEPQEDFSGDIDIDLEQPDLDELSGETSLDLGSDGEMPDELSLETSEFDISPELSGDELLPEDETQEFDDLTAEIEEPEPGSPDEGISLFRNDLPENIVESPEEPDELHQLMEEGALPITTAPEDTSYLEEADQFAEDALDLSDAVIDEPDLSAGIKENPLEEPSLDDISIDLDFGTIEENAQDEVSEISLEPPGEEEPEISIGDDLFTESAETEISLDEIEDAGESAVSGEDDFPQVIPEGFVVEAEDSQIPLDDDMSFTDEEPDIGDENSVSPAAIEPAPEEKKTKAQGNDISGISSNLKQELRTVLSYMDQLLESLPENKIEEFAQSEYFDTYKKLFKELGLV
jgi:hypothetical protein